MASGNTLIIFSPHEHEPPSSNYATLIYRNGIWFLEFDASTDEATIFGGFLPRHYSGGGLTVTLVWVSASATSGDVVWTAAIERNADGGTDMDSDSFAAAQSATATAPSTSGVPKYTTIAFTSGSQMDSLAAGEEFRIKITRDADNGSDNMSGASQLRRVEIQET